MPRFLLLRRQRLGGVEMADDEDGKLIARMDERLKAVEQKLASIDSRIWGAVVLILAYVANKFMGLLQIGGQIP